MDRAVDEAIAAFQSAPLAEDGWAAALEALARATRSRRGQLIGIGGEHAVRFNWVTDFAPDALREFEAIGGGSAAINWRVASMRPAMQVVSEAEYAVARAHMRSDVYTELAERHDFTDGCHTTLMHEGKVMFGLAVLRSRDDGPTGEADRAVFARLAPHALAAVRMQRALEHQGTALLAGAFASMRVPAFLVDARGRVMSLTSPADTLLADTSAVTIVDGRLHTAHPPQHRALSAAIARGLAREDGAPADAARLWLTPPGAARATTLCEVFRLPRQAWTFGFEPRLLVTLRVPAALDAGHRTLLQGLLDLSWAEADVAALVAEGHSRQDIATLRHTSPATVNAQLKSIFRKADVVREVQLAVLINKLVR